MIFYFVIQLYKQMASSQEMVRVGEPIDLFYYDADTMKKQAHSTTQNTKFVQAFTNNSVLGGSSTFTFPPTNGLQDVVLVFQLPVITANMTGVNLSQSWAYSLIRQVSFRYGGSSQFFLTGVQLLELAMASQPSRTASQDIANLGGSAITGDNNTAGWNLANFGYVVLTLPHSSPSAVGKAHPFPTDLLTQQVQITVELNPLLNIVSATNAGLALYATANPTSYTQAYAQFQQVMLNNQGDALARRMDMSVNAYAFPCQFVQQLFQQSLGAYVYTPGSANNPISVSLTGFRAGEVKEICIWLTETSIANTASARNATLLTAPVSVVMSYAGDIYARFDNQSSTIWNLINGNKANQINYSGWTGGGGSALSALTTTSQWVCLPFAQTLVDEDSHYTLVHGKPITNGIVNLDIVPPTGTWTLNVSYILNSTLLMSMGTADFVF
jgi:hypothetical protein